MNNGGENYKMDSCVISFPRRFFPFYLGQHADRKKTKTKPSQNFPTAQRKRKQRQQQKPPTPNQNRITGKLNNTS